MSEKTLTAPTANASEEVMDAFLARADKEELAPLWKVLHGLVPVTPNPGCDSHIWKYKQVRPYLLEACELISTELAERRVLVLENPSLRGKTRIAQDLFAGLQIILPGEIAPAHRHVASALRFIIEGSNAYTAVNGERTFMEPGDFVITPTWTWHDHGNESDAPMVWLDGLDMHIVNMLSTSFREDGKTARHELTRPDDASLVEMGYSMVPADDKPNHNCSPIFNYPYRRTREALNSMRSHRKPNAHLGYILKYLNPVNGDWAMPTLATWMRLLPQGFVSAPYQSTDSTAFVVVEGQGTVNIEGREFNFEEHDIFVVPSWQSYQIQAERDVVLFNYSDRAVQEKLGLFREHRG